MYMSTLCACEGGKFYSKFKTYDFKFLALNHNYHTKVFLTSYRDMILELQLR